MLPETLLRRRVLFVAAAAITINVLGVTAASAERGVASSRAVPAAAPAPVAAPTEPATTAAPTTQPPPPPAPVSTVAVTNPHPEAPATPSTLALEAPAPTEPPAPAPAPAPQPAPARQPSDPLARAQQAMQESAPGNWLAAVPHRIKIIEGTTSYGSTDGTIYVSRFHAGGDWDHLRSVVAHEFGHLIAYAYGSQAYLGAPPTGWPDPGYGRPEEEWADCVEYAFTAIADPAYGMPVCSGSTLSWTQDWLATHP